MATDEAYIKLSERSGHAEPKLLHKILEEYLVNPKIKVTPLRLPPRNEYDDIDCGWELKL